MTAFKSIEHIKERFGISSNNHEEIRRELLKRLKKAHPDTKEQAQTKADVRPDEAVHLTAALDFLDERRRETAVVPAAEVTSLVQSIKDLVPASKDRELELKLSQHIDTHIEHVQTTGRLSRSFLTGFALVLTVIWLFPSLTDTHPVLSRYINVENTVFNMIWIALLCYTAALWLIFSLWRNREIAARKRLKLEATQNRIFKAFIVSLSEYQPAASHPGFYKDQFIQHIEGYHKSSSAVSSLLLGRVRPVDGELAQTLAAIVLLRAEKKGLLQKDTTASLREHYTLMVPPQDL